MLYAFRCSQHTGHVDVLWGSLGEDGLHSHLHTDAGGEHGVGYDECLAVYLGRSQIFDVYAYLGVRLVGILSVSTHEGIARVVEDIEESLVKRQSGTEYGTYHHPVGRQTDTCHAQRCSDVLRLIVEGFRNFESFVLAYALDVVAE